MFRRTTLWKAIASFVLISELSTALAQGLGASRGETYEPSARTSRLGPAPGAGANPLGSSPGAGETVFEGRLGINGPRVVADPVGLQAPPTREADIGLTAASPISPASPYGSLALPSSADDGPPDGMTLDQAIDRLVQCNLDLLSKSYEIPQAEADVLTAGLRANPVLYSDVQCVPYGSFSRNRPGGQTQYDLNITYPLDITGKRRSRTLVAVRAKRVLEAQFQDAIRQEIDNLYVEFVDVLAARETVREARRGAAELEREPGGQPARPVDNDERLEVQREAAEIALAAAEEQLRADLRTLGALIKLAPAEAERLELRASLRDSAAPPADDVALVRLALVSRPDLTAHRLGVGRSEADVALALANRYPDLFLLYQPYTFQDDSPIDRKSAHSWGIGLAVPMPLFNRNQGNIQRARLNVEQTQAELSGLEDRVVFEVRQAERAYVVTRSAVERLERSLLPKARREHDRVNRLYLAGDADELAFLTAEQDFDRIVRQYRDAIVQHRRAMLRLNTAVGIRILP